MAITFPKDSNNKVGIFRPAEDNTNFYVPVVNFEKDGTTPSEPALENPLNTKQGQIVVSSSENFWARLAREGRLRYIYAAGNSVPSDNSYFNLCYINPSIGSRLYPRKAIISCTVDAELVVIVDTNIADLAGDNLDTIYHVAWCKAGTPLIVDFDGEVFCDNGGDIHLSIRTTNTSGKVYGSVHAVEVASNA